MERVRRRWWTVLVTGTASLVVFGALLTAGFQLVMLLAPGYREDIAAYVGRMAGQPVDIGGVSLGWNTLSPRLDLTDITLYGADGESPALSADRLSVGFSLLRLASGNTMPERIELSGLELVAQIGADGRLTVRGLDTAGGPSRANADWLRQLGKFERIRLRNCEVTLEDPRLQGPAPRFRLAQAKISFKEGHGTATAQLALPVNMGSMVEFDAAIDGDLEKIESWMGQWSAEVDGLVGLPWLDALLAPDADIGFRDTTLRLSGEIAGGRPGAVKAELTAGAIVGRRAKAESALRDVRVLANLRPDGRGWLADIERLAITGVNGPWPVTHARVHWEGGDRPAVDADAEYLDLRDLAAWAPLIAFRGLDQEAARLKRLSGAVRRLVVHWSGAGEGPRFSLRADLASLGLAESPTIPGFSGISGEFSATENEGRLALRDAPFTLRYPKVFSHEAVFEKVSGEIAWARSAEGWQVRMPRFGWELEGSRGEGDFELFIPGGGEGSPRLRLDARFGAADVTRLKTFMPLHWGEGLRRWLDRSVLAGRAPTARLRIAGDLADFPFEEKPGTFALDLDLADGRLAFAPDWPPLEDLSAHLEFRGDGLAVSADGGTIGGNRVEHAQAIIPNLREGQLTVEAEAQGDAAKFYDVLRASPLASHLSGLLGRTSATGESTVMLNLDIPLHDAKNIQVDGTARLTGAELTVAGLSEPIRDIRGDLKFTTHGVTADALTASLYDTPLTASITQDAAGLNRLTGQFTFVPDASGTGITKLLPAFLHARLIGTSAWQAQLDLNGMDANHLRLSSDLRGLQVKLPEPMEKAPDEAWPIAVTIGGDNAFPLRIGLDLQERMGAEFAFRHDEAGTPLEMARGLVRVGGAPGVPHATEDGLLINGTVTDLDPIGWIRATSRTASEETGSGGPTLMRVDVNVGRLIVGHEAVEGVRLVHEPAGGGSVTRLSGNGAVGQLDYRAGADGGRLTGRFEHLHVAKVPKKIEPLPPAEPGAPPVPPPDTGPPIDPTYVPTFDFAVERFEIGETEFGRLDFRTVRIPEGQKIERLATKGPDGEFGATGEWRRGDGRSSGNLSADFDGRGFADLLQGFGYAPNFSTKRAKVEVRLNWPASLASAPKGLDWAQSEGRIGLEMEAGMLKAVEPGAGRVLGLLNFYALPRRLTLDFRDVTSKGLAFDKIKGNFEIGKGVADTTDLDVKAPSLKMEVRGRVGLAARDYDQHVKVYPDVSSGITLGALLLGGPAVGALALLAQTVLDKPLDQVSSLNYHLTGTWDDPEVVHDSGASEAPGAKPAAPVPSAPASSAPVRPANPSSTPLAPVVPASLTSVR